jgi:hypothetical protein
MTGLMVANAEPVTAGESEATTTVQSLPEDHPLTTISVEAYVRDYFKNTPILAEISKCESTFRQFDSKGRVVRGRVNSDDVGIMQINEFYHGEKAVELGYDLYTLDGNLGYATWLYSKYGDSPWIHSKPCWKKHLQVARG